MDWNCTQIEERLSEYVDGALSPAEEREFRAHADHCAICTPLVARVGRMVARMKALEPIDAPAGLSERILVRTLGPRTEKKKWPGLLEWLRPAWQPRFAMGVATVSLSLIIVFQALGVHPTQITAADLNPVNLYKAANRHAHLAYARSVKFVNDLRVVYEIQSRLRPEATPQPSATPEPAPTPAPSKPDQKSDKPEKDKSRNASNVTLLASLGSSRPERSLQ